MAKENSQTFCGIVVLMIFMVFWVSFVTAAKAEKPVPGRNDTKGTDDATERLVQANDNGAKKSIPKKGFVYIIKMVGTANFKPPEFIKVGKTNNLVKRRSDLNAGNPFRLAYVAAWKVTDMKEGEKQAHKYLNTGKLSVKPYLDGGSEWFALPTSTQGRSGLDKVHDEIQELLKINSLLDRNIDGSIVASKESLKKY